ncbi:MAG: hypothetical protein V3W31_08625 [Thermodesulfobacteriota bacterium]
MSKTAKPAKKTSPAAKTMEELKSRFHDAFFMNEYGRLEAIRSERYGNQFSVILTHIDAFQDRKQVPDKKKFLDFLKEVVTTIQQVVRDCDVVGMLEDRRIITVLPHTDYFGALITIRKLTKAVTKLKMADGHAAPVIFAQATYPKDANGYGELVGVASKKISERKDSLWEKLSLKDKIFWEITASVLGKGHEGKGYSNFDIGQGQDIPRPFMDVIGDMVIKEITRVPDKRGILYIGTKSLELDRHMKKLLDSAGTTATKIFVVGEDVGGKFETKGATPIALSDHRLGEVTFTFFLNEDLAYAFLCKESWGDTFTCFQTSDPYFVDGLLAKFQKDYSLQEQL